MSRIMFESTVCPFSVILLTIGVTTSLLNPIAITFSTTSSLRIQLLFLLSPELDSESIMDAVGNA